MRLKRLLIRSFMAHPQTDLDFDKLPSLVYIYGRNLDHADSDFTNASGKSTLLYAIQWALWGRISHPDYSHKNSVISHNTEGCHVELDLVGPEGLLQIVRSKLSKGSEKLSAFLGGQPLSEPIQDSLEKFYGISWEVFCNTHFLGPHSKTTQFVTAQASERAKILGELINDGVFQAAAVRAGAELQHLTNERDRALEACKQLNLNLESLKATVQRIHGAYNSEQAAQREREEVVGKQMSQLEVEILKRRDQIARPPSQNAMEVQSTLNAVEEELTRAQTTAAVLRGKLGGQAPRVGDTCPTCCQPFSSIAAQELEKIHAGWKIQLRAVEIDAQKITGAVRDLRAQLHQVQSWGQFKEGVEREINMLRAQVYQMKNSLENRTLVVLHQEKEAAITNYRQTEELLREKQKLVSEVNLRTPVLKTLQQGFKVEIRNMLLDDVRRVLEFYASQYAQVLAENEFTLEFPPTTKTGREKFEILVRRAGHENPLVSGGEGYRAQLAILLALRKALSHQSKCPFEFLLIDEVLSSVDEAGGRSVGRLIGMLQADFAHILVTSPREVEGEGAVLLVERQNRMSRVVN